MIWAGICSYIKAAPGCQKSSPSYMFNSLNFDSEKLSETTLWDHLKGKFVPMHAMGRVIQISGWHGRETLLGLQYIEA